MFEDSARTDGGHGLERGAGQPGGRWKRHERAVAGITLLIALFLGITGWLFTRDTTHVGLAWSAAFIGLIRWVQGQGVMAAVWLIVLQALLVVLVIPGPFFTLGAGFLFGLAGGSLIAVAGSTLGAVAAYGIGHSLHVIREKRAETTRGRRVSASAAPDGPDTTGAQPAEAGGCARGEGWASHPRMRLLARVVRVGGWRIVLSTRLVPLFPFKLSNYFFGWMRFPFAPFFWGTLIGLVPITMVSVAAGALVSDLSGLTNPDLTAGGGWIWSLVTLGVGVVVLLWAGVRARALYREALREEALPEYGAGSGVMQGAGGVGGQREVIR